MHKAKGYNYHKLARQTGFIKKQSIREKLDSRRPKKELEKRLVEEKYSLYERENMKFGIFNKKGYKPIVLFETREEAEKCLAETFRKPEYYEVREIIDFGV